MISVGASLPSAVASGNKRLPGVMAPQPPAAGPSPKKHAKFGGKGRTSPFQVNHQPQKRGRRIPAPPSQPIGASPRPGKKRRPPDLPNLAKGGQYDIGEVTDGEHHLTCSGAVQDTAQVQGTRCVGSGGLLCADG